jgi:hypothetical protein
MGAALDPPPHQSSFLQRLDVFRGAGERHLKGGGEIADAALAPGESLKDCPPRGIGQSVEDGVQAVGVMFNHVVEYSSRVIIVNRMVE